ncbi:hypothetical protein K437DRAFT_255823 [Tilletiaria anomala UBC 951]|uniref:ADF-H domain-containing protein n=1 Tax=Tilletiaria anomala (strain ATCC 24038 / CBS 436.72 / UBC 951) TaxID=1037660 RepID=A0A066W9T6_TILAU|nr:uncharacterized protein K437DRAFT_255823 [Tilletiaria anomala UBC 951]KDN47545.1 hypothetical protein K437DRAFT_255823 [Tilletiaria anomala UBC 951]
MASATVPVAPDLVSTFDSLTASKSDSPPTRALLVRPTPAGAMRPTLALIRDFPTAPPSGSDAVSASETFTQCLKELLLGAGPEETNLSGYVLYRLDSRAAAGTWEWICCAYQPDGAKVKEKMLYATTRTSLLSALNERNFLDTLFGSSLKDFSFPSKLRNSRKHDYQNPQLSTRGKAASEAAGTGTGGARRNFGAVTSGGGTKAAAEAGMAASAGKSAASGMPFGAPAPRFTSGGLAARANAGAVGPSSVPGEAPAVADEGVEKQQVRSSNAPAAVTSAAAPEPPVVKAEEVLEMQTEENAIEEKTESTIEPSPVAPEGPSVAKPASESNPSQSASASDSTATSSLSPTVVPLDRIPYETSVVSNAYGATLLAEYAGALKTFDPAQLPPPQPGSLAVTTPRMSVEDCELRSAISDASHCPESLDIIASLTSESAAAHIAAVPDKSASDAVADSAAPVAASSSSAEAVTSATEASAPAVSQNGANDSGAVSSTPSATADASALHHGIQAAPPMSRRESMPSSDDPELLGRQAAANHEVEESVLAPQSATISEQHSADDVGAGADSSGSRACPGAGTTSIGVGQGASDHFTQSERELESIKLAQKAEGSAAPRSTISLGVGCTIDEDVELAIRGLTSHLLDTSEWNTVVLSIDTKAEVLQLDQAPRFVSATDLCSLLSSTEPRLLFYRYNYERRSSGGSGAGSVPSSAKPATVLYIYCCPSQSPIRSKMLYSCNVLPLLAAVRHIEGMHVGKKIEVSDPAELTSVRLAEEVKAMQAPLTHIEQGLAGINAADAIENGAVEVDTSDAVPVAAAKVEAEALKTFSRPKKPGRR